jgi:alkylation response protein AidB-like acyl-CoA dehydrogenase
MTIAHPSDPAIDMVRFQNFIDQNIRPHLRAWKKSGRLPRHLFSDLGKRGWLGLSVGEGLAHLADCRSRAALLQRLARLSPGMAISILAHMDLGYAGVHLFGSDRLRRQYGPDAAAGRIILCLGNTEGHAGSDAASIRLQAEKTSRGWCLNGTKSYVTNGAIADYAVITGLTDPEATRNRRHSMFLVDLRSTGVSRRKLNKQVWIPSDLTRLTFKEVLVPEDHLLGQRGHGLSQVLTVFTHSRVPISALTLGTAEGAFELALQRLETRQVFGQPLGRFQAKAFEAADFHARIEAARLMVVAACRAVDQNRPFRQMASMAKYLTVDIARAVSAWAADLFGAASVMAQHPIHQFPLDAWASSLGEGTQDIQKLIIFRELMISRKERHL